jgi:hypothetical protein
LCVPLLDDAAEAWIVADVFGDSNIDLSQPGALRDERIARSFILMTKLAFVLVVAFELPLILELAHLKAKQHKIINGCVWNFMLVFFKLIEVFNKT